MFNCAIRNGTNSERAICNGLDESPDNFILNKWYFEVNKRYNMKESLHDIGKAIQRHIEKEKASYTRIPAIGRACYWKSLLFS